MESYPLNNNRSQEKRGYNFFDKQNLYKIP